MSATEHPCPNGDDCALNSGAIHCFHCRRNWPRDWTWDVPLADRPVKQSEISIIARRQLRRMLHG